jgi:hypothetical protein
MNVHAWNPVTVCHLLPDRPSSRPILLTACLRLDCGQPTRSACHR